MRPNRRCNKWAGVTRVQMYAADRLTYVLTTVCLSWTVMTRTIRCGSKRRRPVWRSAFTNLDQASSKAADTYTDAYTRSSYFFRTPSYRPTVKMTFVSVTASTKISYQPRGRIAQQIEALSLSHQSRMTQFQKWHSICSSMCN